MAAISQARRYAQAALELGLERNELELWRRDLDTLATLWADSDLRPYLEDVRLSKEARLARCREKLAGHLSPLALNLILVLLSRGRSSLIPYIARAFQELERQREHTVVAHVTSASAMSEDQMTALREQLARQTAKDVVLDTHVDPSILGGLVVKIGDQLLDLSLTARLERLRGQVVGRQA
ncbi:MAG TPA: ATP synthase F1 subunit delta [Chloroflexota bacterium]|nr:ATP synthase F1 subunit delta [Chloroflexota bacterium]